MEKAENRDGRVTLSPLVAEGRGCLVCEDVPGIERVRLRGVEFYYHGKPWQQVIRRSDDLFELVEQGIFKWPAVDRIARAEFEVLLKHSRGLQRLVLGAGGAPVDPRSEASPALLEWFRARGFIED